MRLAHKLQAVPELMRDLNITLAKLSRTAPADGPGGVPEIDPVKMPFNVGAARARDDLHAILAAWAKLVSEERTTAVLGYADGKPVVNHVPTPLTCKDNPTQISGWLLQYTGWLRRHPAAADALLEISDAVAAVERMIDVRPRLQYIGPCTALTDDGHRVVTCTADLYAKEDAATVTCRACGTEWDMWLRRSANLRAAANVVSDPETISRALQSNGVPVSVERIYKWRQRGMLTPARTNPKTGRSQYRFGDVHALFERMQKPTPPKGTNAS
jgi:hypothetical protein